MEHEPDLDRARVLLGLKDVYGVDADGVVFVPVGYATACYRVVVDGSATWFLKLFPNTAVTASVIDRLPAVVELLRELSGSFRTANVPAPIPTRAQDLIAVIEDLPAILFPYIDGVPAGDDAEIWRRSAAVLAELHTTPCPSSVVLPEDRFDADLVETVRSALDDVESLNEDVTSNAAVRELVLPRRRDIDLQLQRLRDLGRELRARDAPKAICHSDFGGDNLLVAADGAMTVIDWDGATIAPPEQDLWIATQTEARPFLHAYIAAGGVTDLQPERFEFYLLRRYIEDMGARLLDLLYERPTPAAAADALDGMARWGWDQWDQLDEKVASITAAIATA